MSEMPATLNDVLSAIISERGGPDAFDVKQMLAARGLVRLMACLNDGDLAKAGSIAVLESMLPPRPAPPEKGPTALEVTFVNEQLAKLSDEEIANLEAIVCRMTGETPVEVQPTPEQIAFKALQSERDQWRSRSLFLEGEFSRVVREKDALERLENRLKTSPAPLPPSDEETAPTVNARAATDPSSDGPAGNVVPLRANAVPASDPYCGLANPALDRDNAPHLDSLKAGWPEW
jgi:hypothetical protein